MNIQELLEWRYATKVFDTDKKVKQAIEEFSAKNSFNIYKYQLFVLGS